VFSAQYNADLVTATIPSISNSEGNWGVQLFSLRKEGVREDDARFVLHAITTIYFLHRRNIIMNLRDSVSKPFKKLKYRLVEGIRKRKEGSRSDSHREEGETDVEESEADQSFHLHSETESVAKTRPSREENDGEGGSAVQVNPPTSPPSISHKDSRKPDSMSTILLVVPSLIVSLANAGTPAVPNTAQEALHSNKSGPNIADKNKSDWKATASAAAKIFLRGVRDSADAFGPLKSVAGGLCFILENCEVWPFFHAYYPQRLWVFQRTKANKQAIGSLAPRIKTLSASLCTPVSKDDLKERERRKRLER